MNGADINILVHIFCIHIFFLLLDKCREEELLNQSIGVSLVAKHSSEFILFYIFTKKGMKVSFALYHHKFKALMYFSI